MTTILYDSASVRHIACMAMLLGINPDATVTDLKGKTTGNVTGIIAAIGAGTVDDLYVCSDCLKVDEVRGTARVTVSGIGLATEIAYLTVTIGADTFPIGVVTSAAGGVNADAALLTASINAGTARHGFTAVNTGAPSAVVDISAPVGSGVAANAYALGVDADSAGALALTITTTFAVAATGVSAVGAAGDLTQAQVVTLIAKLKAGSVPVQSATSQAGAAATITLVNTASAVNDYYNDMWIYTTGGVGPNQWAYITDYVGATKVATVHKAWVTNPDHTTTYQIFDTYLQMWDDSVALSGRRSPRRLWEWYSDFMVPRVIHELSDWKINHTQAVADWVITAIPAAGVAALMQINEGAGAFTVATYTVGATDGIAEVAAGLKVNLMLNMQTYGYSATLKTTTITNDTVRVTAPIGDGTAANAYVPSVSGVGFAATVPGTFTGGANSLVPTYLDRFIRTYMHTPGSGEFNTGWQKLLDRYGTLVLQGMDVAPEQDFEYLDEIQDKGKIIYDYSLI